MSDVSELLTVGQAAKLAGVSVRTMRRRVAAGQVMTAGHGQARRIVAVSVAAPIIPSETAATTTGGHHGDSDRAANAAMTADSTAMNEAMTEATAATEKTPTPEIGPLVELVERLTERLAEQTGLTAMWQARAQVLDERVRALEAPKPAPAPAAECSRRREHRLLRISLAVAGALAVALGLAPAWAR